jgi:hypothetical protein
MSAETQALCSQYQDNPGKRCARIEAINQEIIEVSCGRKKSYWAIKRGRKNAQSGASAKQFSDNPETHR